MSQSGRDVRKLILPSICSVKVHKQSGIWRRILGIKEPTMHLDRYDAIMTRKRKTFAVARQGMFRCILNEHS